MISSRVFLPLFFIVALPQQPQDLLRIASAVEQGRIRMPDSSNSSTPDV